MPTPGQGIVQGGGVPCLGCCGRKKSSGIAAGLYLCHQRRGGGVDNGDRGNKRWLTLTLQTPFCRFVFRAPPSRGPALQCRWTPALAGAGTAGTAVQLSMCAIWQQPHSFNETDRHPSRTSGTRPAAKVQTYLPLRRTLPPKRRDDPPWTAAPLHAPPLHEPSRP